MNGQDAFEQLCNRLLEEVGRVVAPLGVDKSVKRLQQGMAQTVTDGRMTTQAGSFVVQISPRQLYVHKKGDDPQVNSRSVWRSLYETLSTEEWRPFDELFAQLARHHQQLSWSDLRHVLGFFIERGWVERRDEDWYRLCRTMKVTCDGVEDRLERVFSALPVIMQGIDGFVLEKPSALVKVVSFTGSEEDLGEFFQALGRWVEHYFSGKESREGHEFKVVFTSAGMDSPGGT